jgi:hypothetical protein
MTGASRGPARALSGAGDTLRHLLNFIRRVTLSVATCSSVSDTFKRDRAKARNVVAVGEPIKAVDAVRRLECDCHPGLGHSGVEVVSNGMLHRNVLAMRS